MSNKVSSVNSSRLLDNKLSVILEDLNEDLKDAGIVEREVLLSQFNSVVNKFFRTLNSPLLSDTNFRPGTFPSIDELNSAMLDVFKDLQIIYKEINSLEAFITSNFNTLNTIGSALRGRLRRVSSDLGDYRLYAKDNLGGAKYYSDSFQNTEKIDYADRLYNGSKCGIDIQSGAVTLPIDPNKTETYTVSSTSIGSGSNGIAGNNQETGALLRAELKNITDANPDTWFEFERVSKTQSKVPLVLELKFALEKDSIINTVALNSTSFATRNYPRVTKLETSIDGREFTDIIDSVPSSVVFGDTRDRVVILDPSSGKFSGVTKIKIPPQKIRYVNMVIQMDDSYVINTSSGLRYRKAIGLRDVDFIGEVYDASGEIVSINYNAPDEIKKVALISNSQTTQNLTDIRHMVSVDDGQNWYDIQSVDRIGREISEILNFNVEGVDSIDTESPAVSIRHKAILERVPNGFSTRGGVERRREDASEFRTISPGTQEIVLANRPISNTVSISNVSFGSVGGEDFYFIPSNQAVERNGNLYVYLPDEPFYRNSIVKDQEIVRINNEVWERVGSLSGQASDAKVYTFDYLNNVIKFGDNAEGLKPTNDIYFGLSREQAAVTQDNPRKIKLAFTSDRVKESTSVYRLEEEQAAQAINVQKNATIIRLGRRDISSLTITSDPSGVFSSEVPFVNGSEELSVAGEYSVDYLNGIIYTFSETADDSDTIIDFNYRPRTEVENFSFIGNDIQIGEDDYVSTKSSETISIGSPTNVIRLSKSFVEPRSIRFLTLNGSFATEVPFKGDGTEFNLNLSPADLDGYYTVDYKNGIIYTYSQVSGSLMLEYNTTSYFVEYNIAVGVPSDSFTINEEENTVIFTNRYIIKNFSDSLNIATFRSLFKVDYSYVTELQQNPRELEPYFTPLLKDYALTILTKEQL